VGCVTLLQLLADCGGAAPVELCGNLWDLLQILVSQMAIDDP
jgi:hypothetical protein